MLSKLTRREKFLLYFLLCLIIVVGTVCLLILPTLTTNSELEQQLDEKQLQLQELQMKKATLSRTLERVEELDGSITKLYENLLTDSATSEQLDLFVTLAATGVGISPEVLSISGLGDMEVYSYMADQPISTDTASAGETNPDSTQAENAILVPAATVQITGTCPYASYVRLMDVFTAKPQLLIESSSYSSGENGEGSFQLSLRFYLLPERTADVSAVAGGQSQSSN